MRIWIINNYAIPPRFGGLVRHYYFSKFLAQAGHAVRIFTGSQIHNTPHNIADPGKLVKEVDMDGVPYTYVHVMGYAKNNYRRAINILQFPIRTVRAMERFYRAGERPDVIYASSPIPTAGERALAFAKKHAIPFVFEVRDLWPESLVDYGNLQKKIWARPILAALYRLEHYLYKKSDRLLFTMAGGGDYIRDKGWRDVDLTKIHQINNGLDLTEFRENLAHFHYQDADLDDPKTYKILYMGSIRSIYELDKILDAAKLVQEAMPEVRFYFFGQGTELGRLKKRLVEEGIRNASFKGPVPKEMIPSILVRGDLSLLHHRLVHLLHYGTSNNKLFEYLAAGRPILSTVKSAYSLVADHGLGLEVEDQEPETILEGIRKLRALSREEIADIKRRSQALVEKYDYQSLSRDLEAVFQDLLRKP